MKKLEGGSWKKYGKFLTSRPSTSNFSTSKLYDFQLPSSDFQHFFFTSDSVLDKTFTAGGGRERGGWGQGWGGSGLLCAR